MRPTGYQTQKRRPDVGRRFQITLSRSRERDQFRLLPYQIDPVDSSGTEIQSNIGEKEDSWNTFPKRRRNGILNGNRRESIG